MDRKAQGLSLNTIIIAVLVLIVLVVLIVIFSGKLGDFSDKTSTDSTTGGICIAKLGRSCEKDCSDGKTRVPGSTKGSWTDCGKDRDCCE